MSEKDNARIVQELFDAWNSHDPDGLAKLLDDEYVEESDTLPGPIRGREGARQVMLMYVRAFPDLRLSIARLLPSGEHVTVCWQATGTHKGELMGIAPTNRWAETHGCSVVQLRNGKVLNSWIYWDTGNLLRQLGVLPGPSQASSR
ncbi:MAG: ester cyclase [Candidatus Rokuibacteriota bacterium]